MKTIILHAVALLLLPAVFQSVSARQTDFQYLTGFADVQYHRVDATVIEQTYHLYVKLPGDYQEARQYPVIYLLDGGACFPMLAGYYRYLRFAKSVPEAIVVGISYGVVGFEDGNMRSRDFTAPSSERSFWGGAADFAKVFREDIFPLIEGQYQVDAARRVIFGQSLGGQFVLFAALTAPDLFFGYIASNPALHRNLDFFLQPPPKSGQTKKLPRLFASSGVLDQPRFRKPAVAFMTHWRAQRNLPWALRMESLEDHDHYSAAPEAFRRGLRWIFGKVE